MIEEINMESMQSPEVKWNSKIKLVVSDVDETLADLFVPVAPEMATELNGLLTEGKSLFLVTGAGLASVKRRITDAIDPKLRKQILVSHCSGAEVIGFGEDGEILAEPHYSLYDETLTQEQKEKWRTIVFCVCVCVRPDYMTERERTRKKRALLSYTHIHTHTYSRIYIRRHTHI